MLHIKCDYTAVNLYPLSTHGMIENAKKILLASHGTSGAQAAEQIVFKTCHRSAHVTHLVIVPIFWKNILGDDWLNNDVTRNRFCGYLEAELENELNINLTRVRNHLKDRCITNTNKILLGDPDRSLLETCENYSYDLVVMGSPRPRSVAGLNSRMSTSLLTRELSTPLIIAPYPNA